MRRGMASRAGRSVAVQLWRMRGRRFITAAGSGGMCMECGMGMELGSEVWGMAGRVMDGWVRMIRDMTRGTTLGMTLETLRDTGRGMETAGRTMLGRIRMGRV